MVLNDTAAVTTGESTDGDLLRAWGDGDAQSYEALVARYAPLVYGRCRRALGDSDADDATQAVFLVLARRREQAAGCPVLAAWLMRVAENVVRNALRDRQRRRHAERAAPPPQPAVEEPTMSGFQDHLDACLADLPEAERNAITLHHLAGLSLAEVAVRSDAGVSTVKDRLNRGLERLRKAFLARGLTLSVPLLLSLLASEAQAAVPAAVITQLNGLNHPDGGTDSTTVASARAQHWSKERLSTMTRIAIAGSVLLLISGSLTAFALTAEPDTPPAAAPPVQPAVPAVAASNISAPYLDPERARSWVVIRWNDGPRTVERLRRTPEFALLPAEGLAVLTQIGSLQRAEMVVHAEALVPHAERVRHYASEQELARLPPAGQVERIRAEFERMLASNTGGDVSAKLTVTATSTAGMPAKLTVTTTSTAGEPAAVEADGMLPWPGLDGWLEFTAADAPGITGIRGLLDSGTALLGTTPHAVAGGWRLDSGLGACQVSIERNRVLLRGAEPLADARIDAQANQLDDAAELTCTLVLDPGLPGSRPVRTGGVHLTVTDDGLRLSSVTGWSTPEQVGRAGSGPRLDLRRLDDVPADAFLAAALPMHPEATRTSVVWQSMFLLQRAVASQAGLNAGDVSAMEGTFSRLRSVIEAIDGTVLCWVEPGAPIPTVTFEVDMAQAAADGLIASLRVPRAADGSVNLLVGMVNLNVGWRQGRLICTTNPGGVDGIDRHGGFTAQPDVRRGLAAMPYRNLQACVLLRPAAFATAVGPYISMLGGDWMQRMQAYEQRLTTDQSYGFLTVAEDARGFHIDAAGMLSIVAGGVLGAVSSGPMSMLRVAN